MHLHVYLFLCSWWDYIIIYKVAIPRCQDILVIIPLGIVGMRLLSCLKVSSLQIVQKKTCEISRSLVFFVLQSQYIYGYVSWNRQDGVRQMNCLYYTVKPAHAVTSIKQSSVLKGHCFRVLSWKISYELNLF